MSGTLFLAHRIPFPPDKGDKIRSWHMLRHLARRGPVHLGCFYDDPADAQHIPFLRTICTDVLALPISPLVQRVRSLPALLGQGSMSCAYYRDARMKRWVDQLVGQTAIDRAFVFSTAMAPYVLGDDGPAAHSRHGRRRFREMARLGRGAARPDGAAAAA